MWAFTRQIGLKLFEDDEFLPCTKQKAEKNKNGEERELQGEAMQELGRGAHHQPRADALTSRFIRSTVAPHLHRDKGNCPQEEYNDDGITDACGEINEGVNRLRDLDVRKHHAMSQRARCC